MYFSSVVGHGMARDWQRLGELSSDMVADHRTTIEAKKLSPNVLDVIVLSRGVRCVL
jgi:hypothetical protein